MRHDPTAVGDERLRASSIVIDTFRSASVAARDRRAHGTVVCISVVLAERPMPDGVLPGQHAFSPGARLSEFQGREAIGLRLRLDGVGIANLDGPDQS